MGPEQWLFLQWHEHKGSLVSTFEKLFERNTFVDCTLAAEGQYLNVHKMILSACSPYFEILLNENRDKHPIIILKDVKFRSLKSIIEYMYRGEANVLSTEMTDFLAAAETLQIKGIGKQGGGDTRTQPKNLRDLMEEQSRPPCPTMQIIKEEKDNWADSDLSSALTETVQDSFVTQNAVLFSQGDGGATIALPQKLPKAEAAAEEAEAAAPGLGSHTEPVRPAAPQADWAGAASAGDAGPLEAAPKAEADADLPAPAPPPAPAPAPRPPPADMEDAETASLGSSVIELSDTTEEWAEEEDMDEGQAAHAHALAPAAEESRARFEAASDVARDSASRDLGSEQDALGRCLTDRKSILQDLVWMMEKIKKSSTSLNIENERTIHRVKNIRVPHNTKVSCLRKQNFVRKYPTPWNFSTNVRPATSSEVPSTRFSNKYSCAPKRHYCPVCHKGFTWLCCLKRHMKIHSKFEKIYQCEECGYMTRRFKDFKAHQYKHRTGNYDPIRYYTCPVCDETFNWLCDLKSHMQKHNTHIRKKSKEVDQPALTLPSCLERIRTHFKKGHFKCFQCNKEFLNGKQLIRHINRVHGYPQSKSRKKE